MVLALTLTIGEGRIIASALGFPKALDHRYGIIGHLPFPNIFHTGPGLSCF